MLVGRDLRLTGPVEVATGRPPTPSAPARRKKTTTHTPKYTTRSNALGS